VHGCSWTEHAGDVLMVGSDATMYIISNILGGRGMIVSLQPQDFGSTDPIFVDSGYYFAMESTHHDPAGTP